MLYTQQAQVLVDRSDTAPDYSGEVSDHLNEVFDQVSDACVPGDKPRDADGCVDRESDCIQLEPFSCDLQASYMEVPLETRESLVSKLSIMKHTA